MSKIQLSEAAEADLTEIWFYIAQDNIEAADRFIDLIHEKCSMLAGSPNMGIQRPDLAGDIRSFPVGNYIIFYRPTKSRIEVARILSGSRDIPGLFEGS